MRTALKWREAGITVAAIILILMLFNYQQIIYRQSIVVTIEDLSVPVRCHSREVIIFPGVRRDFVPLTRGFSYCGVINTDHGGFRLIENGMFLLGSMNRKSILEDLQVGCTHELRYIGTGEPPGLGAGFRNYDIPIVYSVSPPIEC